MYDVFSLKDFSFPKNFLWGSGYSGHQVEGNNFNSHFWELEKELNLRERSGMACNSYELYGEDVKLVETLSHQAFRTSVEWCRIETQCGTFDKNAVEHYIKLFSTLKEKGIKVFCTLVHNSVPIWFHREGGFTKRENVKYFENYLEYIVPKLSPYVDFWNVLNEFNLRHAESINHIFFHARGYHIIKKYSKAPVSSAHAMVEYCPQRKNDKLDNLMAQYKDYCSQEFFFHAIRTGELVFPFKDGILEKELKDTVDYWSINVYTREMVDSRLKNLAGKRYDHKLLKMIDMDFYLDEMYPETIINGLSRLMDKPIYITENGCACNDDNFRIVYMTLYLSALCEAIKMGADVRGYLYWSLLDNYEWGSFIPKFGLCSVDRKTFKREPKPSAYFYKEIIKNNGVTQEIIRKYLKQLPTL